MQDLLIFKVKGFSYNFKFPNVGGYRQIQVNKQLLSNNTYKSLIQTSHNGSQLAADMVDIEATLSVIAPDQFFKDLPSESISGLGLLDFNELRTAYIDQIVPWWNAIEKALSLNEDEKTTQE
jgi:hypothetical protein